MSLEDDMAKIVQSGMDSSFLNGCNFCRGVIEVVRQETAKAHASSEYLKALDDVLRMIRERMGDFVKDKNLLAQAEQNYQLIKSGKAENEQAN